MNEQETRNPARSKDGADSYLPRDSDLRSETICANVCVKAHSCGSACPLQAQLHSIVVLAQQLL